MTVNVRQNRLRDEATIKRLVGRRIVRVEPGGSLEDGVWMHDWRLTLDDDTVVAFVTKEHPDGGNSVHVALYGTDIILAGGRGSM